MRLSQIQQRLWILLFSFFLVLSPLGAQNGNGNGNAGGNNPNGNNRDGDKNKPNYPRGFDISDTRISDRGRDRRDIFHGRGRLRWPKNPTGIKLDWNYDVGGGGSVFEGPYPVNAAPAKWNFLYANETTGDNDNDRVYVATNAVAGRTQSDSFSSSSLDGTWHFRDPVGSANYSLTANPDHLQINLPSGSSHDCWNTTFECATMLQPARNIDATYETKIDGVNINPSVNGSSYGIMLWQDDLNYLQIWYSWGGGGIETGLTKILAGVGTVPLQTSVTLGASNYLRVTRSGSTFTVYYSQNGTTWTTVGSHTQALTVNRVGLCVENWGSNPANTANFDYFTVSGEAAPRYKVFNPHNELSELGTQGGQTYLRMDEATGDTPSSVTLSGSISSTGAASQQVSTNTFVSSRGNPGPMTITAGTVWNKWQELWSSKNNTNKAFIRLFKVSGNPPTLTQIVDSSQTANLGNSSGSYNLTFTFASDVSLSSTDRLAFQIWATKGASTQTVFFKIETGTGGYLTTNIPASNVYAFSDVYNTVGAPYQEPFCLWQKAIGNGAGKIDGSSITLSLDGSRMIFASTEGKVYCLNTADGSTLWTYDAYSPIRNSMPFWDYLYDHVWIGSEDGKLHKINAFSGTLIQKSTTKISSHASQYALHSTPVRYSFGGIDEVLVGADDGFVYRLNPDTLAVLGSYNLTRSGTTTAADAIWATPIFDVDTNSMAVAVNGVFHKVNLITGVKNSVTLWATAGSITYSSPVIDWDNGFAYVGGGQKLWKVPYNAWNVAYSTSTQGTNPNDTYPRSSPLWVSGATSYIYIGDGGGYMNRFIADIFGSNPFLANAFQIAPTTADSDSPIIMDYFTGNIYFGATNGRLYQLSQTF